MSYQVLARKWRPQTFEEVVGQSGITQTLANAIRLNRIGHAFLFCGSRGIGKTTTARILAKALNCESGPTDTPCNTCRHCREIIQGNAMDVVEIDGVSNRGIDEIRELRENVKYTPATARFKVIIIDEVHMLTREAFNALLKTLEEPPPHAKFILATTEAHKVPVTIVSRCQRYDFRRIDVATLTEFLRDMCRREDIQAEDSTLEVLARMADGGLRDSLSLLDQVISFSGREIDHEKTMQLLGRIDPGLMFDVFRYIAGGNGAGALERFGAYVDGGGSETVFHREMLDLTRDILAAKMNAPSRSSLPEDLPELFSVDQLERIFNVLLDLEQSFRQTEFPRLLMDVALVKMSRIRSLVPLEDILAQLKRMGSGSAGYPAATPGREPERAPVPRPPVRLSPARGSAPRSAGDIPRPPANRPEPSRPDPAAQKKKPVVPDTGSAGNTSQKVTRTPDKGFRRKASGGAPGTPGNDSGRESGNGVGGTTGNQDIPLRKAVQIEDKPDTDNSALRALIAQLDETHAPLRGMLTYAAVKRDTDEELVLVFHPDYRFHMELMDQYGDVTGLLAGAAAKAFGSPRKISYGMGDRNAPRAVIDQDILEKRRREARKIELAGSRPEVARVMKMFRGEIREVVLRESPGGDLKKAPGSLDLPSGNAVDEPVDTGDDDILEDDDAE